jgi:hypothetical protein
MTDLLKDMDDSPCRHRSMLLHRGIKISPCQQLHGEIEGSIRGQPEVKQIYRVGRLERGGRLGFAAKPFNQDVGRFRRGGP